MLAPPNYDNLMPEIVDALTLHYRTWVAEHSGEKIYAYVIYPVPLIAAIGMSVLTEQGLKQVAWEYKTKHGYEQSLEQLAINLRWSVADTPYCGDYLEIFDSVNERLEGMLSYVDSLELDDPAFDTHYETLESTLVRALNYFRLEVLGGATRPILYVDFGDMSDEDRLRFIKLCNTPEMVNWYIATNKKAR